MVRKTEDATLTDDNSQSDYYCPDTNMVIPNPVSCQNRKKFRDNTECQKCSGPRELSARVKPKPSAPPHLRSKTLTPKPQVKAAVKKTQPASTKKKQPEIRKCKEDGCDAVLCEVNESGYCRSHAMRHIRKDYAPKRLEALRNTKDGVANPNRYGKTCRMPDCDRVLSKYNQSGFCAKHVASSYARKVAPEPSARPDTVVVDFSGYPEILSALQAAAKDDVRTPGKQVLFMIKQQLADNAQSEQSRGR